MAFSPIACVNGGGVMFPVMFSVMELVVFGISPSYGLRKKINR
jgi:hypothetical protein